MNTFVSCTWADIADEVTDENARRYMKETDKLVFCADLTGLSVDSRLLGRFENALIERARELEEEAENDQLDYLEREKLYL
jgi:hypothetical protein